MKTIREMTQAELGAFVQSHLREKNITVALSGGAAVSIYSEAKYVSLDLDFVNIYAVRMSSIINAMQEIGFEESARYFKHPDSQYFVEFPPGPRQHIHDLDVGLRLSLICTPSQTLLNLFTILTHRSLKYQFI